jgi:sec-independent protein translocase protein TatA
MGRSMRIFKSEVRGLHDDDNRAATALPIGSTVGSTVGAAPVTEPTPVTHDAVA